MMGDREGDANRADTRTRSKGRRVGALLSRQDAESVKGTTAHDEICCRPMKRRQRHDAERTVPAEILCHRVRVSAMAVGRTPKPH